MRDSFGLTPTVRAHALAGRLFVPVLVLMAAVILYAIAGEVRGVANRAIDRIAAADSAGLVR